MTGRKNKKHGYWSNPDNLLKEIKRYPSFTEFAKANPSGARIAYRDGLLEKLDIPRRGYSKRSEVDDTPKVKIRAVPKVVT